MEPTLTTVYFATNRNQGGPGAFGGQFSPDGAQDLTFGEAQLTADGELDSFSVAPSGELFAKFKEIMAKDKRDALVMIHGFNTTFLQSLQGAAKFVQSYPSANVCPIMFSWPSLGEAFALGTPPYFTDTQHAAQSGPAVARAILKCREFLLQVKEPCGRRIFLLAHSRGNFVLQNAMPTLKELAPNLPRIFTKVIMAAADVDADALENPDKLGRLPDLANEVVCYFNKSDEALFISNATKGNPARLGHDGPLHPQNLRSNVTAVNVSRTNGFGIEGFVGHGYYDSNPLVEADLLQVLQGFDPHQIKGRTWSPAQGCYVLAD